MFQEAKSRTHFFNTSGDGILPKPLGLKDRYGKNHVICLEIFGKPQKYKSIYMLPLKGVLYKIENILQVLTSPSIAVFTLTFQIAEAITGTHYEFMNQSRTGGVTISETRNICGVHALLFEYYKDDVEQIDVQCSNKGPCFYVKWASRFFTKKSEETVEYALFIGGHPDDKRSSDVLITNFEIYACAYQEKTP